MNEPTEIVTGSPQFLVQVLEALADPVFVKNEDHVWVFVNEAFCRFHGHPRAALLGKSDFEFSPDDEARVFWAIDDKVFHSGQTIENEETFTGPDGVTKTISTKKSLVTTTSGKKLLVGVIRDLTELKEKERQLREARDRAESADSAKTRFLARMSHEFRTPLNGIIGITDLLLDRRLEPDLHEQIQLVRESSSHLLRLVNDLLHFSPLRAGGPERPPEEFKWRNLVTSLHSFFDPLVRKESLSFYTELSVDIPESVIGDPRGLRQVLINLVGNALKFTPAGGEVTLRVQNLGQSKIRFSVQDTGIGIDLHEQGRIFEPFVKLTPFAKGTGLGLTVVKELLSTMGSELQVESEPGKGSKFSFVLNLPTASKSRPTARPQALELSPMPGFKVLVVEDDKVSQKVAVLTLRRLQCEVSAVDNGAEALDYLQHSTPDLVLLDCQMPVMDGFEFCRRLREWENQQARERLPVVALTAHALEEERRRCLDVGMDHWLTKPLQRGEVWNVLSAYYQAKQQADGLT